MNFKELYSFSLDEEKEVEKTHTRKKLLQDKTATRKTLT